MEESTDDNEASLLCEGSFTEQTNQIQEYADDTTSENKLEEMSACESFQKVETTSSEMFNSSDTGSWSSETPLLPGKGVDSKELPHVEENVIVDKTYKNELGTKDKEVDETFDTFVYVDIDPSNGQLAPLEGKTFTSNASVAYSHSRDAERLKTNPVHVFGSGWEFGSVCSINLHSAAEANADCMHDNTKDSPWQGRLLSRIFKDKIGSMPLDKSTIKDTSAPKFKSNETSDSPQDVSYPARNKNLKNLLILSTGITFLHIAVYGLRNLQSSINSEEGLGVFSLASIGGAFMFGSLLSPFVVRRYRPKICLSVSCFGHLIYVIANYYPSFYVIIPASVIQGLSSALLWNALCTYITEIGLDEAFVKGKASYSVLSRYFGIFFLILQLSMVLGNLISSLILSQSENRMKTNQIKGSAPIANSVLYDIVVTPTLHEIGSMPNNASIPQMTCGSSHCDVKGGNETKPSVDDLDKLFLLGTYSSCAIISILVIHCCLDQLSNYTPHSVSLKVALRQARSVLAMMVDRKFCFIVMLCLYTVLSNGFVVADVLKAFITCPVGVRMVGYSMICFGLCGSVSSYMFGKLAKCIGHVGAFLAAAMLNLTSLAVMVSWEPTPQDQYFLFALIGAWGFADGIWQSQTNSLISSVFADRYETAFGCCRVLQGLAGIIVFTISNVICMRLKIVFTAAICLMSVVLYILMELVQRVTKKTQSEVEMSY